MYLLKIFIMELPKILEQIERVKKCILKGNIFRSEPSTNQLIECIIFEMMANKEIISPSFIRKAFRGKYKKTPNYDNCVDLFDLWEKEIKIHNIKNQPIIKKEKQETKTERKGFVYLMIDKNTNYHKIGFSKNPKFREKTLQSEKPTIELLHKIKGTMSKEKELHKKYKSKNVRGEWFNLTTEDVNYIKTL